MEGRGVTAALLRLLLASPSRRHPHPCSRPQAAARHRCTAHCCARHCQPRFLRAGPNPPHRAQPPHMGQPGPTTSKRSRPPHGPPPCPACGPPLFLRRLRSHVPILTLRPALPPNGGRRGCSGAGLAGADLIGVAEELLAVLLRLGLLRPRKEGIINLADVRALHVDRRGGGDAVRLVHSPQGHTVQLVRAGHEQQARGQLLEEDHALAAEAAAKQDQHRARLDGLLELRDAPRVGLALTRHLRLDVVGRVPLGCLDLRHFPLLAVLAPTDSLLHPAREGAWG